MDTSNEQPSIEETVNAVTDVQLHRYNAATLDCPDVPALGGKSVVLGFTCQHRSE